MPQFSAREYEVDSSEIFKPEVGNLSHVSNLADVFRSFGYSSDDRVDRRELCKMWGATKRDIEAEIMRLAHNNGYETAKKLRARLVSLRREFDALQTDTVRNSQAVQYEKFSLAEEEMKSKLMEETAELLNHTNHECHQLQAELEMSRAIENENLEFEISKLPVPRVMYSKRAIELKKAESELIRLAQYDDARKVSLMLEKLLPKEQEACTKKFDREIQQRRDVLARKQKYDAIKVEEKVKGLQFTGARMADKRHEIGVQRIKNHKTDMEHAHHHERRLRPEMSVKPSALWQKRPGYTATDAALRGDQLLHIARTGGKKALTASPPKQVFAASLTDKHDFFDHTKLPNTGTL
jgi:hypothetical protein